MYVENSTEFTKWLPAQYTHSDQEWSLRSITKIVSRLAPSIQTSADYFVFFPLGSRIFRKFLFHLQATTILLKVPVALQNRQQALKQIMVTRLLWQPRLYTIVYIHLGDVKVFYDHLGLPIILWSSYFLILKLFSYWPKYPHYIFLIRKTVNGVGIFLKEHVLFFI